MFARALAVEPEIVTRVREAQRARPKLLLRHIGNIFRFSSSDFAQSLLRLLALTIGRVGDDGLLPGVKPRGSLE